MNILVNSGSVFWFCALSGSGLFLIQFLINLFGMGDSDSDIKQFKWLSLQAVTGFLMMFGWSAITCQNQFEAQILPTLFISLGVGLVAAWTIHVLIGLTKKLHSDGTVYKIEDAIGQEATVYQKIPKDGVGKVTLALHHFTHEIDAVSREEIESFTRVKIIEKAGRNTVIVVRI